VTDRRSDGIVPPPESEARAVRLPAHPPIVRAATVGRRSAAGEHRVASKLLFDIDHIDRNEVVVPYDEVGRLNPQCGDMRQLHHVIWMSPGREQAFGVKYVRDNEFWVPGHIPGRPLLPGVIMIEAAAQLSSVTYQRKVNAHIFIGFIRCDNVIFRGQVVPGDDLFLLAKEREFGTRRFICDTQGVVNGKLVFEAQITGMPM
jgi:3-hydroxyacyl-[acyl-carrier-protein] dehydratase